MSHKIPDGANGYFAVVIPAADFYQGFYLFSGLERQAEALIKKVKQQTGGKYMPATAVISETDLVASDEQSFLGSLMALLVEVVATSNADAVPVVSAAIVQMTKSRFFWVLADRHRDGTRTNLFVLPASIDDARDAVNCLPEVRDIVNRIALSKDTRH